MTEKMTRQEGIVHNQIGHTRMRISQILDMIVELAEKSNNKNDLKRLIETAKALKQADQDGAGW